MPTLPELESAFAKADQAGNAEDAAAFAAEIKRLRATNAAPPPRRRALDIMGSDTKLQQDRAALKTPQGREALTKRNDRGAMGALADMGLEAGGAAGGQAIGALPVFSVPTGGASVPMLGAAGGSIGNALAQLRRIKSGEQEGFKVGENLSMAGLSAIPGAGPEAVGARAMLREGAKQAVAGGAAKSIATAIDEGRAPTTGEMLASTLIPAAGGALAQKLGSVSPDKLNQVERETLERMQARGGKILTSEASDSTLNDILVGIAGPEKTTQAIKRANANTLDKLAREEAGLSAGQSLTKENLKDARDRLAKPYRDVSAISTGAKDKLEEWQVLTNETLKDARKNLDLTPGPTARAEFKRVKAIEEATFDDLQQMAIAAGKPELAAELRQARIDIAKNHSVEDAMIIGSGRIDPAVLARKLKAVGPDGLTGGLGDIGAFTQAFSRDVGNIANVPSAGMSAVDAVTGAFMAKNAPSVGAGILGGGIPLLRNPVRSVVLSEPYQKFMTRRPSSMPNAALAVRTGAQAAGQESTSSPVPAARPPDEENVAQAELPPPVAAEVTSDAPTPAPTAAPALPTLSPAEAKAAPAGTRFIGSNGKTYETTGGGKNKLVEADWQDVELPDGAKARVRLKK